MKGLLFAIALVAPAFAVTAQTPPAAPPPERAEPARHLVMIVGAGPNFANIRNHMEEARAHQALYERLAAEGRTIASGPFEGEPVMGMTIWSAGVDEAQARELIREDQLPALGIVTYEFRTLRVRTGALGR